MEGGDGASLDEHRYKIQAAIAPSRASTTITIMTTRPRLRWARRRAGSSGGRGLCGFGARIENGSDTAQLGCDRGGTLRSMIDVGREHPSDNLLEFRRDVPIERAQHKTPRPLSAAEHLEQNGAERINVAARVCGLPGRSPPERRKARPSSIGDIPPAVNRDRPKFMNFARSFGVIMIVSGRISPWIMSTACASASASARLMRELERAPHVQRAAGDHRGKRLPLDELEDEKSLTALLALLEQHGDVRMRQLDAAAPPCREATEDAADRERSPAEEP